MMELLADKIWEHAQFHSETKKLRELSIKRKYIFGQEDEKIEYDILIRLLKSSVILSYSNKKAYREASYGIVTSATELIGHDLDGIPYLLLIALSRMGNFPALSYAKKRYKILEERLPTKIYAENYFRQMGNTVSIRNDEAQLTDFQKSLWDELNHSLTLGISAPTSAGKSYVLQAYSHQQFISGRADKIAFIVPTRALLNQVLDDVRDWVSVEGGEIEIITTPVSKETELPKRAVFILTQERLQMLFLAHPYLKFQLMVIDEAQSIGDGSRGVLLSSVIEEALFRNDKMQLLFAGPNLREPGSVSRIFGRSQRSVDTSEATVSQNIIFVDCDALDLRSAKISLLAGTDKVPLGTIITDQELLDHNSKLVNLSLRLGQGGQSLVYAMGPAECERIAFGLSDIDTKESDETLVDLSNFIKEAVHPKYQLAQTVLKKVGYHYGRLPSLVRKSIEEAFSEGRLRYLVTTSTLLYGVNLPAQNLFLHNPQKGQNQPIQPVDFWNLAGRAGRLGKEFSGNIFLIDYSEWLNDPLSGDRDQVVEPAIESHIRNRIDELITYMSDPGIVPDRLEPDEFENTSVKLVRDTLEGRIDQTLDRMGLDSEDPRRIELKSSISNSIKGYEVDLEVISSSPTVSIHRQQSLYKRLEESLKKKGPEYIIPRHPLLKDAYTSYVAAIKRCHDEILKYPKGDRSSVYYAQIALTWMKGAPLPQIIDSSYNYKLKNKQNPNISTVIRSTLTEVENDLRFKYVRLFTCYNAVLEKLLRNNNLEKYIKTIPSVPLYLEIGACTPTMISFMGLGMSRFTAGKLREMPRRTNMTQAEAKEWLRSQDIDSFNLPNASINEIKRLGLSV